MSKDHFKTHYYQKDRVDWNFNILLGNQPDVIRMVNEYAAILKDQPGLYDPVPPEWLHITMLRIGLTDDYTEAEVLEVADLLAPELAALRLPPEFILDSWWQWGPNIVLHASPENELKRVYQMIISALHEVVGEARTLQAPTGNLLPHVTVSYGRDRDNEVSIAKLLGDNPVRPASFTVPSLSLIRQWPADGRYEWEVVRELAISNLSKHNS